MINKTNDGGKTWRTMNPSNYRNYERTDGLSFVNDSTGFVTITNGYGDCLLAKTKDRGETWRSIDSAHYMGQICFSG